MSAFEQGRLDYKRIVQTDMNFSTMLYRLMSVVKHKQGEYVKQYVEGMEYARDIEW